MTLKKGEESRLVAVSSKHTSHNISYAPALGKPRKYDQAATIACTSWKSLTTKQPDRLWTIFISHAAATVNAVTQLQLGSSVNDGYPKMVLSSASADVYATIVLPADIGTEATVVLRAATGYAALFLFAHARFMPSLIRFRAAAESRLRPLLPFAARLPCKATIAWLRRSRSPSNSAMMAAVSMSPLFVGGEPLRKFTQGLCFCRPHLSGSSRMLNEPNGCTTASGRSFFIAWLPGSETL